MAQSPPLNTDRLSIVPFAEEHLTLQYVNWLNNPAVVRYSEQRHQTHTLESCRKYWMSFDGSPNYFWAIIVNTAQKRHIGNINAYVDINNSVADVGILIGDTSIWGQGYGSEAWIAVCQYLINQVGIRKVTAGTLSVNAAMLALMRNAGMVEDGCRIRQYLLEGQEVDMVHMALFREE